MPHNPSCKPDDAAPGASSNEVVHGLSKTRERVAAYSGIAAILLMGLQTRWVYIFAFWEFYAAKEPLGPVPSFAEYCGYYWPWGLGLLLAFLSIAAAGISWQLIWGLPGICLAIWEARDFLRF